MWRQLQEHDCKGKLFVISGQEDPVDDIVPLLQAGVGDDEIVACYHVAASDFSAMIDRIRGFGARAAWINNPHKVSAGRMGQGFSIVRETMGVANLLSFEGGDIYARNTEIPALVTLLSHKPVGKALVLGAGQASRSVIMALLELGWKVSVWNRSSRKVQPLKTLFLRYGEITMLLDPDPTGCQLVVNATPLGKKPGEMPNLLWKHVRPKTIFLDMVVRRVPTVFLREASNRGLPAIDGRQAHVEAVAEALEILGYKPDRDQILVASGLNLERVHKIEADTDVRA